MRKASTRSIPPPLELLCLNALWSLEQGSVKDVRELVAPRHPLAYTTVMTVLDRLARRGVGLGAVTWVAQDLGGQALTSQGSTRSKAGRAFLYTPAVSRDAMRRLALQEFLDSYFESSHHQLLQFLQVESRIQPATPAALMASGLDPALL